MSSDPQDEMLTLRAQLAAAGKNYRDLQMLYEGSMAAATARIQELEDELQKFKEERNEVQS